VSTEERRKEIQQIREEHKHLAEKLVLGTEYSETLTVYGKDRQPHEVTVHALSDGEFLAAAKEAHANLADLKGPETILANMDLMMLLAAKSTRIPDIRDQLIQGETYKIARKALEISQPPKS